MPAPRTAPHLYEREAIQKLGGAVVSAMWQYLRGHAPTLMGAQQPPIFLHLMFFCWLGHDILARSYPFMFAEITLPHRIGVKTLQVNVKRIRLAIRDWAKEQIFLGTRQYWDAAVENIPFPPFMRSVRFWLDSSDYKIQRKKGRGRKSEHWSGKLGRPARRFMMLVLGDGCVAYIWGGYSPKVYDGHHVEIFKQWYNANFNGLAVVADGHFYSVARELRECTMIAPKPDHSAPDPVTGANLSRLTQEEQARNAHIRTIRARVEITFASILNLVSSLKHPWAEQLSELDATVTIGVGIHNFRKRL